MAPDETINAGGGGFATTHWSMVALAAKSCNAGAEDALERLAGRYWYPLYVYLRRKGVDAHQAEDLVQDFFARRIVTRQIFNGVDASEGRFRSWLLSSLQNFERNEWDKRNALKRGGGKTHVPIQTSECEERYGAEPSHDFTPEKVFERTWAITLLEQAIANLREEYVDKGIEDEFDEFRQFLPGANSPSPYSEVAQRLGKTEAAVKMAVSRFRKEFGVTLREEIRCTVSCSEELDSELRHLISIIGG